MKFYLLDTNILIALFSKKTFFKTQKYLQEKIKPGNTFATCGIILTEFLTGVDQNQRKTYAPFLEKLYFLESARKIYEKAGYTTANLRKKGKIVSLADGVITEITKEYNATLVTGDKDFKNFENLKINFLNF